jgi:hypothetical protein
MVSQEVHEETGPAVGLFLASLDFLGPMTLEKSQKV